VSDSRVSGARRIGGEFPEICNREIYGETTSRPAVAGTGAGRVNKSQCRERKPRAMTRALRPRRASLAATFPVRLDGAANRSGLLLEGARGGAVSGVVVSPVLRVVLAPSRRIENVGCLSDRK
jgi:hypothetical protein